MLSDYGVAVQLEWFMDKELQAVFAEAWLGSFAWQIPSFFSALMIC